MARLPKYNADMTNIQQGAVSPVYISVPYSFQFQCKGRNWEARRNFSKATGEGMQLWTVGTVGVKFTPKFSVEALPNTEANVSHAQGVYAQVRMGLALYFSQNTK